MNWSSLALAGLCLTGVGCNNATQTNTANAAAGGAVSDFAAPALKGLVVRDHPGGAQVVTPPERETRMLREQRFPRIGFPQGGIVTRVNGTPVRNAAHFRDLMNGAAERREDPVLNITLLPREITNDSVAF